MASGWQNNSPKAIATREREAKALELRKAGATFDAIAQAVGFADESGALRAVSRALKRIGSESIEEMRMLETERLNDLHRRTMEILVRRHPVLYKGAPVKDDNGNVLDDDGVKLEAVGTLLKLQESYRRLFGLDAPKAVEIVTPAEAVPAEERAAALGESLRAFLAGAEAQRQIIDVRSNGVDDPD